MALRQLDPNALPKRDKPVKRRPPALKIAPAPLVELDLAWPDERPIQPSERQRCVEQIRQQAAAGVKLLGLDFDQTLISDHTGGRWRGSVGALAALVRPLFQVVVSEALAMELRVAVVTHSGQPGLIKQALSQAIPDSASVIVVAGKHELWLARGGDEPPSQVGPVDPPEGKRGRKIRHMVAAGAELGVESLDRMILIDDDELNCVEFEAVGGRAARFDPDNPFEINMG